MYLVLSLYAYNLARLLILLGNESLQLYLSIFKSHISFNKCTIFNNAFHKVHIYILYECVLSTLQAESSIGQIENVDFSD